MADLKHQFNDPSLKTLVGLARMNPWALEHIKEASVDPSYGDDLPDTAFAWEDRRMFPIDTPANALVSKLYIEKQAAHIPDFVKEAVDAALLLYQIDPREISVETEGEKTASVGDYVFPDKQRWEVKDSNDYKLAEATLLQSDREIPFLEKTAAAVRLCKMAPKYSVTPSIELQKLAGNVVSDLNQTIDWLNARATIADETTAPLYTKLANELEGEYPLHYNRSTLVKLAELIHTLDQKSGLEEYYNRSIPDPIHTVFNTEKKAEPIIQIESKPVPLSKLMMVPVSVWEQLMGPDLESITTDGDLDPKKLLEVVPTLPKDMKLVLLRYL
jgi:hypothetical protein